MAAITKTILVDDTLRYSSDFGSSYYWARVYKYYQDTGQNRYNVFGKSGSTRNAALIPIPAFDFTGRGQSIALRMYCYYPEAHTFRWALCVSDANRASYQGTSDQVEDAYQIAQGTFSPAKSSGNNSEITLTATANIPSNTPLFLYIWSYESGNFAPHILRNASYEQGVYVTLDYISGVAHLDTGTEIITVVPYIDTGTAFVPVVPYGDNGETWEVMA